MSEEGPVIVWKYFVVNGMLMRTDGVEVTMPPRGRCVGPVYTCQKIKRRGCVKQILEDGVLFPKDEADRLIGQHLKTK